jgi:cyclopropane-fatty-acyl-phospholipid synthase
MLDAMIEKNLLPDSALRLGIRRLLRQRLRTEAQGGLEASHDRFMGFLETLKASPIAINTVEANDQHYELPVEFFQQVLGPQLKYSSGYWPEGVQSLDQAEEAMLALTAARAGLQDGQQILELGCGWGSLTLWMAERFPSARITAVSNSAPQRDHILAQARERGLDNLQVLTADMNTFDPPERVYHRVVSVEMFEHMRNYEVLMGRIASWLAPGGKLFVHIFTHREHAYPFEVHDDTDWMARNFFTGGVMPSDHTLLYFQRDLRIQSHWRVNGRHYQTTANAWLQRLDAGREQLLALFRITYGSNQALKRFVQWRVFFMACAELFGFGGGERWFVSHYLFEKTPRTAVEGNP